MSVSVITPTFNRAGLLSVAIESVLAQKAETDELIIVDDGSTDDTRLAVEAYLQQPGVSYVRQNNQGRSEARNHGARLARGRWFGFLDSDDAYVPGAFAKLELAAKASPDVGMFVGSRVLVDSSGQIIERLSVDVKTDFSWQGWLHHCYGVPSCTFIRRDWFDRAGGFNKEYETAEDWELYLRLAWLACPMKAWPQPICQYRIHDGNSTRFIEDHLSAAAKTLEHQFECATPHPDVVRLRSSALASLYSTMAVQAIGVRNSGIAPVLLTQAMQYDAAFLYRNRIGLLEDILYSRQRAGETEDIQHLLLQALPSGMNISKRDMARAQSRIVMRRFFWTQHDDPYNAWQHLKIALSLDPGWFFNRGVISFLFKMLIRRTSTSQTDRVEARPGTR